MAANFNTSSLANQYADTQTAKLIGRGARPDFIQGLSVPAPETLIGTRAEELVKVLGFINSKFGSHTLMKYVSVINNPADPTNHGRVKLVIPQDAFFGSEPGYFQLRYSWPEITKDSNVLVAKLTLNYRIDPTTFENTLLMPGGGNGDPKGWTNINSAQIPVHELLSPELNFIAESARADIVRFCRERLEQPERAVLTLTPQSDVHITLRNTIVPLEGRRAATGRQIIPTNNKQPGDDAGIGMASIWFTGATILPRISPLVKPDGVSVNPMTAHELFASYGLQVARPTAEYDQSSNVMPPVVQDCGY